MSFNLRDARAVRSSRALQIGLLTLIERKPLEQITIREIAAEAGVHYSTFFRHHPSKEALLDEVAAEQIQALVELALPVLDRADNQAALVALFGYVGDRRTLWTALLTGDAAGTMREELLRISRQVAIDREAKADWLAVELAMSCSVSLIFETLAWWLAQEPESVSIEHMSRILDRLLSAVQQA